MQPFSPILVAALVLAAIVAAVLARWLPAQAPAPTRDGPLLGLRGVMAFAVFLHHALIWHHYLHDFGWRDAAVSRQFGECRVVLFFMVTSALFYGKLLDERGRDFDWLRLYVARLLRLGPAYWVAMLLMFAVVTVAVNLHTDGAGTALAFRTWTDIFNACAVWLGFSMLGLPAIDGYLNTSIVTAGVTWTMPYEWTFYLLRPLMALPLRVGMRAATLALGLGAAVWLAAWAPDWRICLPFIGGMGVALVVRLPRVVALLRHRAFSLPALAAVAAAGLLFPTMFGPLPMLLLGFALAIVAAGNDLFGLLSWRVPQALGKWAYSIYLLHGIVLYAILLMVIGADRAAQLSPLQYVGVIAAITPVVLTLAWASHHWVESPPLRKTSAVVAALRGLRERLRGLLGRKPAAQTPSAVA
jgi:peptidoglycan/LPS O-acetylase OafA/YrhL